MLVEHKEENGKGSFFISENNDVLAEMTYNMESAKKMIIDHTEVDTSLRGKNIGNELLDNAISYARTQGLKIVPLCPFVKSVFDKKESLRDVLD